MEKTERQSIQASMFPDHLTSLVSRVMRITEVTWGEPKQNFIVRYRGQLLGDSLTCYENLASSLRASSITPLFRVEEGLHAIILKEAIRPHSSNPRINIILFVLTLISMVVAGTFSNYQGPLSTNWETIRVHFLPALGKGLAFAISLLGILLAHELGHYLAARYHRTNVTLPYFIPFPLNSFGTMGAFIQLKEPPKNKRVLLDIGVAGPLSGLIVAIPILILGLQLSHLDKLPIILKTGEAIQLEGNSILYLISKYLVFGKLLPLPSGFGELHPFFYWIRYFFTGLPIPFGGVDVLMHPVAYAGWAGLFVTALNLIPLGQLDGGHLLYVLVGSKVRTFLPVILAGLMLLGMFWSGWWVMAFLLFMLGRLYAEPLDQITSLDSNRKVIAIMGLVLFILTFTPVPIRIIGG